MNKKLISSILFFSCLSLVSCGGKPKPSTTSSSGEQSSSETSSSGEQNSSEASSSMDDKYELVKSTLDVTSECETTTLTSDFVKGPFTIVSGTEIRNRTKTWTDPTTSEIKSFEKSIKLAKTNHMLKVKVNGTGKLSIWAQNGSSGVDTRSVIFTKNDGSVIEKKLPAQSVSDDFPEYPAGSPVVKVTIDVTDGEYSINRDSGTVDIYYAELEVISEKSEEVGFIISNKGDVEYVEGETYSPDHILLNALYGNGKTESISLKDENVTIDSTNVDMSKPGSYKVSVKYKSYEPQTIDVKVYGIKEIKLGFNRIEKGENSNAGNSTYINQTVKQVYGSNETFNYDNLTVRAICSDPVDNTKSKEFIMDKKYINAECPTFDATKQGTYEVQANLNINNKNFNKKYSVHVVTTAPSIVNEVVQVKVDQAYNGIIGEVNEGANMFNTIQQALDFLNNNKASIAQYNKVLNIASGTYKEKLEINIPNLTIVGADKENTIIEWDSLYGIEDESGYIHTTDSTASVNVRDSAINCVMQNITISNWFNCEAHFDEKFGSGYAEHRALALLVQADQFTMDNCKLLGYQDTVEFFTGRQLIKNTYIEGTTDFIFGTNNTTYFYNCEIHSIDNAKGNGGYITAFKGCNKGANDAIKYGAIFDSCNFTAGEKTTSLKKTSIGRCWGAYAAVMVMNSTLGGHITTKGSTGNTKDERYVAMNAKPTDSTVQFTEYNNKGEGALTEAVSGMKLLTQEEAANYNNLAVIFGTTNGKLTYTSVWNVTL